MNSQLTAEQTKQGAEAGKLVGKAVTKLLLQNPFYGFLTCSLDLVQDFGIDTACTDGKQIKYNPAFFLGLDPELPVKGGQKEIQGIMAHEVLHVAYKHHTRRGERDADLWNQACDHVINHELIDAGFTLPDWGLHEARFKGMSEEQVYTILAKEQPPKQNGGGGNGSQGQNGQKGQPSKKAANMGGVQDCPNPNDPNAPASQADKTEAEQDINRKVAQAAQQAKNRGTVPGFAKRLIEELYKPVINWREVLAEFVSRAFVQDYTMRRPNTAYLSQGFYLPSLHRENTAELAILIDTSGSIGQKELNVFASELIDICEVAKPERVTVVYVDSQVNHVDVFEQGEDIKLAPHGGGGTDFKPGFRKLDEMGAQPACAIYFTDGWCDSYPPEPEYPVLWGCTDAGRLGNPPFGQGLYADLNQAV